MPLTATTPHISRRALLLLLSSSVFRGGCAVPSSTASRSCCDPSGASLLAVNLLPPLLLRSRREEGGGAKCRALRSRAVMVAICVRLVLCLWRSVFCFFGNKYLGLRKPCDRSAPWYKPNAPYFPRFGIVSTDQSEKMVM